MRFDRYRGIDWTRANWAIGYAMGITDQAVSNKRARLGILKLRTGPQPRSDSRRSLARKELADELERQGEDDEAFQSIQKFRKIADERQKGLDLR